MLLLHLDPADATTLGPYRTRAGWELCAMEESIWIRCPESALEECANLPCRGRYRSDNSGRLTPLDATVPVMMAPGEEWQPLIESILILPVASRMPGTPRERVELSLVRSERETTADALLLSLEELAVWVEQAPRVRLDRLRFAAAPDGRALVIGTPLPPVPGTPHYLCGALALPCGWGFAPHLWPAWVDKSLSLPSGAMALIHENARIEVVGQEGLSPLTLAAIRCTQHGINVTKA